jgi:hypothetical protein
VKGGVPAGRDVTLIEADGLIKILGGLATGSLEEYCEMTPWREASLVI